MRNGRNDGMIIMDVKLLAELTEKYDREFYEKHPDFVKWWAKHAHNTPDPQYAVAPRIAYKCAIYYDEFHELKRMGAV